MVATTNKLMDVHILRAIIELEAETDVQHVAHIHPFRLVGVCALEPEDGFAVGDGRRALGIKDILDDALFHTIGVPAERLPRRPQQHHLAT